MIGKIISLYVIPFPKQKGETDDGNTLRGLQCPQYHAKFSPTFCSEEWTIQLTLKYYSSCKLALRVEDHVDDQMCAIQQIMQTESSDNELHGVPGNHRLVHRSSVSVMDFEAVWNKLIKRCRYHDYYESGSDKLTCCARTMGWVCRFLTAHQHIKAIQCHTMVKSKTKCKWNLLPRTMADYQNKL